MSVVVVAAVVGTGARVVVGAGFGLGGVVTEADPLADRAVLERDCPIEDGHGEHDALGMETAFTEREGAAAPAGSAAAPPTIGTAGDDRPGVTAVDIAAFAFTPADVRVSRGSEVRWTNGDPAPHTATGSGWDTGSLGEGESGSVTFDTAGTFSYVCAIHPAMAGTVTVT